MSTYSAPAPRPLTVTDPMDVMVAGRLVTLHGTGVVGDSVLTGRTVGSAARLSAGGWGRGALQQDTIHLAIPFDELLLPRRRLDPVRTAFTSLGIAFAVVTLGAYLECGSFGC